VIKRQAMHPSRPSDRRRMRRAVACVALGLIAAALMPAAAFADDPSTWEVAPHVSGLQFLVVLFLIPAGLFIVISLLAALPSLISDKGYEPGQTWRSEPEWFGGASKGVDAAESVTPGQLASGESERGGASGTW
jgi:hypothetical protein